MVKFANCTRARNSPNVACSSIDGLTQAQAYLEDVHSRMVEVKAFEAELNDLQVARHCAIIMDELNR